MSPLQADGNFELVTECRYGQFFIPPKDAYVGEALRHYGEYSQIELNMLLQFIAPETRVVSVGANIGAMIVPLAQHCAEVICFEPQRWVHQVLSANIIANNLLNVRAYWAACGKARGVIKVPVLHPYRQNNFGALELEAVQGMGGDSVAVFTLDSIPDNDCGLLQIDVEGMELDVLLGGEKLISRCRPIIFFEADRALKRADVFRHLRSSGYELWWYRTPLFNKDNWKKNPKDIWAGEKNLLVVAENVIAMPKERGIQMNGFIPVLEQ